MRGVASLLLFLPLMAGCAQPDEPGLEAFHATYAIASGLQVSATFGEVVDYLAADGEVRQGYLLHVQYSAPGERVGYDEAVLDADLAIVRTTTCNDWIGGDCQRRSYVWARPDRPLLLAGGFALKGFDGLAHGGDDDHDHEEAPTYDGKLAPRTFVWDGHEVATRIAYEARGDLQPLAAQAPPRFAFHPPGPALPGSDHPLPGTPHSLDSVLDFLREERPEAAAILASGGCLTRLQVHADDHPEATALTVDQEDGQVTVRLSNQTASRSYGVVYGRSRPFEEPALLRTTSVSAGGQGVGFDCARRGPVMAIGDLASLAEESVPDNTGLVLRWETENDGSVRLVYPFSEPISTPRAHVTVDAGWGLSTWWSPVGSIDP